MGCCGSAPQGGAAAKPVKPSAAAARARGASPQRERSLGPSQNGGIDNAMQKQAEEPASAPATRKAERKVGRKRRGKRFEKEWPWSRPEPPVGCKSSRDFFYTREYLKTFKILNAQEAEAYEAYQHGDKARARDILSTQECPSHPLPNTTASTFELRGSSLLDDDPFRDILNDSTSSEGTVDMARDRGGSVSAAIQKPDRMSLSPADMPLSRRSVDLDPEEDKMLLDVIRSCPLFSHLSVNFDEHSTVASAMVPRKLDAGEKLYERNTYPTDEDRGLYVVASGTVSIRNKGKAKETVCVGGIFGETLVMNATSKAAFDAVVGPTGALCWQLDHDAYSHSLSSIAFQRREQYKDRLREVKLADSEPFKDLGEERLAQIADSLVEKTYRTDQKIITFGEPGMFAHFIVKGKVDVIGRRDGVPFKVCSFAAGEDPIGFLEFFEAADSPQAVCCADVVASEQTITACISREHFEQSMGPVKSFLKDVVDQSQVYEYYREALAESIRGSPTHLEGVKTTDSTSDMYANLV
eukprot:TRINITY_DN22576_c0_g1_i1.p1 TRINITY_DN22576_c0_g1~~TRINITY_DN22576_c0_g1_i1.p1  ORF type:complete len:525 (+),score=138.09 TRINITY_DN22576_c0_g1_i1:72-1646(+)